VAATTVSRRLIGRGPELATLLEGLRAAGEGRPSLAFVAGESGVGKTRLLSALAAAARDEGARVLSGECIELGEGELPYAPLIGALRPLVRAGDPALTELPARARRELAALLPGLADDAPAEASAAGSLRETQPRLFEALLAALDRIARDEPLLLVIEDVHWADHSTRDFLAFLGRNLADERIIVALSYRPDELHRRHPLRPLLAVLERTPGARRVELAGLARDEVAELARELTGEEPARELVEQLVARSDGNALFVEELVAAGPGPLPPSLADALMVRIERLSAPAQEIARVLAVAQPADHALLEELAGLDDGALRTALRDAIAGHVVIVGDDDRYTFRHVLLREVVYDDLLPGERASLHLAVAGALERRLETDPAAPAEAALPSAIAHHYAAAGDQPAALRWAVRAADRAERVHAPGDAAVLLDRALQLWDRVPEPAAIAGCDHIDLLLRAGRAHRTIDEGRRLTLIGHAIREARADGADDPRVPMLLRERSMAEWTLGRGEASRATLDLARRMLPDDAPPADRTLLTISRLRLATLQSRFAEAIELAEEGNAIIAGQPEESRLRVEIGLHFGHALIMSGENERGCRILYDAIEEARAGGRMESVGIAYTNLGDALHLRGQSAEAQEVAGRGLAELPRDTMSYLWVRTLAAELAIERGDYPAAREYLDGIGRTSGSSRVNVDLRLAELALATGDLDGGRAAIEEAERLLVDSLEPQFVAVAGVLRAELERRDGTLEAARAAVERALERVEYCSDDTVRLSRLAVTGLAVEADAAQRARDLADGDEERAAIARAEIMLSRARAAAEGAGPVEVALAAMAEGHMLRATGAPADARWRAAAQAWDTLSRPFMATMARWRAAESLLAHGERDGAADAVRDALGAARRLGTGWLAGELEALAARARLPLGEDAGGTSAQAAGAGDEDPFGLTPRERQVLGLVARGATNREIGAELYMAEKTASVHVSRILAKLDVRSRTEAAAVAHRLGLSADA